MIKGINISTQWEISIDIKIEDVQPQWASVFQVSKGFTGTVGDRIPEKVYTNKFSYFMNSRNITCLRLHLITSDVLNARYFYNAHVLCFK